MESSLTDEKVNEICTHLEATAEMIGLPLTYSFEALESIENILLGLKEAGEESALNGASFMCGIYMGEIFRKNMEANWVFDEKQQEHALKINNTLIYPVAKIRKFVKEPESEGLVFYAQVITAKEKS